jgi:broad specificity phosphatase PhoE
MWLYFVRHGETQANAERRHQTPEEPLSNEGERQAGLLSERLKDIEFTHFWSSPMLRAQQTAAIINQYHDLTIQSQNDLREIKRPSLFDQPNVDPEELKKIKENIRAQELTDPYYKFEDGESMVDLINRANQFLKWASQQASSNHDSQTVGVVSHGIILTTILVLALMGSDESPERVLAAIRRLKMTNTGISILQWQEEEWRVVTINDYAHL